MKVISLLTCLWVVLKKQLLFAALSSLAFDLNISIDTVFQIFTWGEKRKSQTAVSFGNFSIFCKTFSKPTYLPSLAFPSFSTFPTNYLTWQPLFPPNHPLLPCYLTFFFFPHFPFLLSLHPCFPLHFFFEPGLVSVDPKVCHWAGGLISGRGIALRRAERGQRPGLGGLCMDLLSTQKMGETAVPLMLRYLNW